MKLVLHNYWRSSASHRVRIALGLKQLPYEYVAVNILHKEQQADAYRSKNPMMQVPTLEVTDDDGSAHLLTQSLPIIEFLEERFPQTPLLPRDPYGRAFVRAFAEIVNSGIQPLQNLSTTKRVKEMGGDEVAWTKAFIESGLAALARMLASRNRIDRYCIGEEPTIADCFLVPQLASARRFGATLHGMHAQLLGIEQRCLALPAFAAAAPDQQPDAQK